MNNIPFLFDLLRNESSNVNKNYPPYNIRVHEKDFLIEVAAAGFSKDELKVEQQSNLLLISGKVQHQISTNMYIHKGISSKSFLHKFGIPDGYQIGNCSYNDGILSVLVQCLEKVEEPKKFNIN